MYTERQIAGWNRLAEALNKVPAEHMQEIDKLASTFVSGMEAMARVVKTEQDKGGQ